MRHSLQFRLLAAFTLVIVVTIGAIFFFIYQATSSEIRQFEERTESMQAARIETELSRYYYQQGGWGGIQPFVEQWGNLSGRQIILTDASGTVVADSGGGTIWENNTTLIHRASLCYPHGDKALSAYCTLASRHQQQWRLIHYNSFTTP